MSDVINSIFGRSKNETSGEYGVTSAADQPATTPETVDSPVIEAEPVVPADGAAETEEVATSTADEDEAAEAAPAEDTVTEPGETEPGNGDAEDDDTDDDTEDDEPEDDEAFVEEETTDEDSDEATTDADEDDATTEEGEEETESDDAPVAATSEAVEEETGEADVEPDTPETRPAAGVRGSTTVGDDVVAQLVTMLTRKTEGVHELAAEGVSAGLDGEVATIAVRVVVEFGHAVKTLAERIRISVIEAVEEFLGLDVAAVDVHVAGIHLPDAS
ncbi:Asp23/Gls24 family envelope stress response protein [Amycolatopsis sp. NPDC059021]|uniref:Asp23/Gls24 family envelope stress response protein n=1 Tax=Amycolatopsis sp. NPDC059021 TaxID=3346704 RepID=UPI00366BE026